MGCTSGATGTANAGKNATITRIKSQADFDRVENQHMQQLENWVSSNAGSIEIDGRRFEKFDDRKEMIDWFKGDGDNTIPPDNQWAFRYKDGSVAVYGEGDNTKGAKLTNIVGAIFENENSTIIYGKVKFENYNDYDDYKKYGEMDWRADV